MGDLRTRILVDLAGNLERRAKRYSGALDQFSKKGQRSMAMLRKGAARTGKMLDGLGGRYTGMLAGAGSAYIATREAKLSARLDKQLIQIRQTAGATEKMSKLLRAELHAMSKETGQSFDSLLGGFNNLIQAGLTWEQSLVTIKAVNPVMAVTGSQAEVLSSALTVAAEAFGFDLSQPKLAVELLDQMTTAGRLGNAELEDLSSIFGRVGINAKAAGLDFAGTLGFIEQLSLIEKNPERLATLADSTLRLFTNQRYKKMAAKATGVKFYDTKGSRREAFAVLDDIAKKYESIKGDQKRDRFIQKAFGKADLDTIKGLRALLSGGAISKAREMSKEIAGSTGTIGRDLEDALANSVDQVGRLKNALREAADGFAQPVNDTVERAVKFLLDEKNLSGGEILAGGAIATLTGLMALKGGGKLLQKLGSTAGGVAAGKALEEAAGVKPVFVVNWPGGSMPGGSMPGGKSGGGIFGPGGGFAPKAAGGRILGAGKGFASKAAGAVALFGGIPLVVAGAVGAGSAISAASKAHGWGAKTYMAGDKEREVMGLAGALRNPREKLLNVADLLSLGVMKPAGSWNETMRAEMVVKVKAEPGTEARTDELRSSNGNFDLQAETEVGMRSGGA